MVVVSSGSVHVRTCEGEGGGGRGGEGGGRGGRRERRCRRKRRGRRIKKREGGKGEREEEERETVSKSLLLYSLQSYSLHSHWTAREQSGVVPLLMRNWTVHR